MGGIRFQEIGYRKVWRWYMEVFPHHKAWADERPGRWRRMWMRLFFGWEWKRGMHYENIYYEVSND